MTHTGQLAMSEQVNIGINKADREMLLQGLRYVRSSVLLEMRDPTDDDTERREVELRKIERLVSQISGSSEAMAGV